MFNKVCLSFMTKREKNNDFGSSRNYVGIKVQKEKTVWHAVLADPYKIRTRICQNHNKPQKRMLVDTYLVFCIE